MAIWQRKLNSGFWLLALLFLLTPLAAQETGQAPPGREVQAPAIKAGDPLDEKISLDYKEVDIATILRSLSYTYGLNLATTGEVKGKITISLRDITLREALDVVLTTNGYNYARKGNIIYITPGSVEGAQLVSEPIAMKYIKAGDAQNLLRKALSPKGDIKVDDIFNLLVVTDYQANIEKLKGLLKSLDLPPQQVLIEAKIVDITSKDLHNLGVTWQLDYNPLHGIFDRKTTYDERLKGTGSFAGPSSSLSGSQFKIDTLVLKGLTATATLDALIQDQKAQLLASPSIAVINNREARIIIGEKVPYKERTQTTTGTTETTKFVDVGTTLRVTPSINADGYITMTLHPEVSSVSALLDAGPRITTREADTMVRVREGETIVIGGLIKQEDNRTQSRTPILGYIPLIGYLFGNRSKDQTQTELAVFITPKILRSRSEMLAAGKDSFQEEAYVNILATSKLNVQMVLLEKADRLEAESGLEARRKDSWILKNQALSLYESIVTQFPESPKAAESALRAARIYYNDMREYSHAKQLCQKIISDYPNSPYVPDAKELYKRVAASLLKEKSGKRAYENAEFLQTADMDSTVVRAMDRAMQDKHSEEIRRQKEEARKKQEAKQEELRKQKEEAKRQQEAKERKQKEEIEAKAKAKAEEQQRLKEEERKKQEAKQEELRREKAAKEEEMRLQKTARDEEMRRAKEEAKRRQEEKAKANALEQQRVKEEARKKQEAKQEELRKQKEEAIAKEKAKQEELRKQKEEAKRQQEAKERKQKEEIEAKAKAKAEEQQRLKEEERKKQEAKQEELRRAKAARDEEIRRQKSEELRLKEEARKKQEAKQEELRRAKAARDEEILRQKEEAKRQQEEKAKAKALEQQRVKEEARKQQEAKAEEARKQKEAALKWALKKEKKLLEEEAQAQRKAIEKEKRLLEEKEQARLEALEKQRKLLEEREQELSEGK